MIVYTESIGINKTDVEIYKLCGNNVNFIKNILRGN